MNKNIITCTDSYKFMNNTSLHGVHNIFSYFESRSGAKYPETMFFGLQYLLKEYLEGVVVTENKIDQAAELTQYHLGSSQKFNRKMWEKIAKEYGGKLPVRISAVPEGTKVATNNVLMTITLTVDDPDLVGLVNHLETLLTNVWSPSLTATKSAHIRSMLNKYAEATCDNNEHVAYQLHDFAQRSSKCPEHAAWAGAGHLINFFGTDTVLAWELLRDYYPADMASIGHSVFATEHNYMMYKGTSGEAKVVAEILEEHPEGIISVVADTYDIYNFVEKIVGQEFKDQIINRNGRFVIRPDSVTPGCPTPATMVLWILKSLEKNFGVTLNSKRYKVLPSEVRVIYGDGLNDSKIEDILETIKEEGYASENVVFGCGSWLLDQHNRDTQRFAYKTSSMLMDGRWQARYKSPLGSNKASKKGRLKLIKDCSDNYFTLSEFENPNEFDDSPCLLVPVFENGEVIKEWTLAEVRANASS